LNSLFADDIEVWMLSSPQDLVKKTRKVILSFGQIQTTESAEKAKFSHTHEITVEALKRIGSSTLLNRMRVEHIYGVNIEDTPHW
jgi:hypothetical protein